MFSLTQSTTASERAFVERRIDDDHAAGVLDGERVVSAAGQKMDARSEGLRFDLSLDGIEGKSESEKPLIPLGIEVAPAGLVDVRHRRRRRGQFEEITRKGRVHGDA